MTSKRVRRPIHEVMESQKDGNPPTLTPSPSPIPTTLAHEETLEGNKEAPTPALRLGEVEKNDEPPHPPLQVACGHKGKNEEEEKEKEKSVACARAARRAQAACSRKVKEEEEHGEEAKAVVAAAPAAHYARGARAYKAKEEGEGEGEGRKEEEEETAVSRRRFRDARARARKVKEEEEVEEEEEEKTSIAGRRARDARARKPKEEEEEEEKEKKEEEGTPVARGARDARKARMKEVQVVRRAQPAAQPRRVGEEEEEDEDEDEDEENTGKTCKAQPVWAAEDATRLRKEARLSAKARRDGSESDDEDEVRPKAEDSPPPRVGPGLGFHPPPPRVQDAGWHTGLFECFQDWTTCCLSTWLSGVALAEMAEILDEGKKPCLVHGTIYYLRTFLSMSHMCYSCKYRKKMREKYHLPEYPWSDLRVHICCEVCSIGQMYRELKIRGIDPHYGWEGVKQHMVAPIHPEMTR